MFPVQLTANRLRSRAQHSGYRSKFSFTDSSYGSPNFLSQQTEGDRTAGKFRKRGKGTRRVRVECRPIFIEIAFDRCAQSFFASPVRFRCRNKRCGNENVKEQSCFLLSGQEPNSYICSFWTYVNVLERACARARMAISATYHGFVRHLRNVNLHRLPPRSVT